MFTTDLHSNKRDYSFFYKIFFIILAVLIYRFGVHIPVFCVDIQQLNNIFQQSKFANFFNVFNLFSGGALSKVSVFTLGVMPYISSSIVLQLLSFYIPHLVHLKKEGQYGQQRFMLYVRVLTVFISLVQAFFLSIYFKEIRIVNLSWYFFIFSITITCGSVFLMWLGEQITEKGFGNGISILIFVGIVSSLPSSILSIFEKIRQNEIEIFSVLLICFLIFFVVFFVVFVENAQRKVLVNHARHQQGKRIYAAQKSYLPLKINIAGVIPLIFSSSLILIPLSFFQSLSSVYSNSSIIEFFTHSLYPGHFLYSIFFICGIIFFNFFYMKLIFNPDEISSNLSKSNAFLLGIRPGKSTSEHLTKLVFKLTWLSSFYLSFLFLIPEFFMYFFNISFYFGGTSLLIVVLVVLDLTNQIQLHFITSRYEKFFKK